MHTPLDLYVAHRGCIFDLVHLWKYKRIRRLRVLKQTVSRLWRLCFWEFCSYNVDTDISTDGAW